MRDDLGVGKTTKRAHGERGDAAESAESDARVEEVGKVLWDHHTAYCATFDFYAAVGASGGTGDLSFISLNVWTQFLLDFDIVDRNSKFLKQSDLDTLFITIDSLAARVQQAALKEEEELKKKAPALARQGTSSLNLLPATTAKFDDKRQKFSRAEVEAAH